jgi:hypothetical protein
MTNKNLARKTVSEEKEVLTNVKESEAPVLSIVTDETEERKEEVPAPEPANKPVATMTIVEKEEVRKPTLEEKIQKVEDLSLLIDRYRALAESRRKLQTFQIGADSMSSTILLRDAAGNEFRTSNSAVITTVIDEMKRTLDSKVREVETLINF